MMQTAAAIRRKSLRRSIKVQFLNHWQLYLMMIPAVAYIITEGRIDTQRLIAAAKEVIDIVDGEGDDLQMYK